MKKHVIPIFTVCIFILLPLATSEASNLFSVTEQFIDPTSGFGNFIVDNSGSDGVLCFGVGLGADDYYTTRATWNSALQTWIDVVSDVIVEGNQRYGIAIPDAWVTSLPTQTEFKNSSFMNNLLAATGGEPIALLGPKVDLFDLPLSMQANPDPQLNALRTEMNDNAMISIFNMMLAGNDHVIMYGADFRLANEFLNGFGLNPILQGEQDPNFFFLANQLQSPFFALSTAVTATGEVDLNAEIVVSVIEGEAQHGTPVPEPMTLVLFGLGIIGSVLRYRS